MDKHPSPAATAGVRIGELARRAGIPAATLRAWERRYGIVDPQRTESGYRLYSAEDERRLRAMVGLIEQGLAPAEAAAQVLRETVGGSGGARGRRESPVTDIEALRADLLEGLRDFDEVAAHAALDRAVAAYGSDNLVHELVLPVLRQTGELWSDGSMSVGQEHFGSQLIRGRLLALGRGWGSGQGPLLLLACAPGEAHDLPLAAFALIMRERGFRIALLGADTPLDTLQSSAASLAPDRIVLSATDPRPAQELAASGPLELGFPTAIGGAAAGPRLADAIGAELLPEAMTDAAERLAATV
jgi:DNA-binding transcriptional MerR regulator